MQQPLHCTYICLSTLVVFTRRGSADHPKSDVDIVVANEKIPPLEFNPFIVFSYFFFFFFYHYVSFIYIILVFLFLIFFSVTFEHGKRGETSGRRTPTIKLQLRWTFGPLSFERKANLRNLTKLGFSKAGNSSVPVFYLLGARFHPASIFQPSSTKIYSIYRSV